MTRIERYPSREEAAAAVARDLVPALEHALGAGPQARARLCLSGGSSPVALYRRLAAVELPWARVDLCLSDERWVPPGDEASNEGLVRRELMSGPAGAARLHGLYRDGLAVDEAAPLVSQSLARTLDGPFDFCLLGMGADGHTASLFPDADDLDAVLGSGAVAVPVHVSRLDRPRLSLTAARLLRSRQIGVLLFGDEKLTVLERALAGNDPKELPVRLIVHQDRVPVTCYWAP